MLNKKKILSIIHVEPEESKIVFFTFLFSFCIGIVLNFMFSVPLSMFLTRFSSAMLPYIYICSGIATFLVSVGFGYLERHVSVFQLLSIPIAFLAFSLFLFWWVLIATNASWVIAILLIWALVVALLLAGVFNVLFNQLFTLQQGKRLFGLMIVGNALGGIISGFGLDYLVNTIGPNQVILLTACILCIGLGIQFLIKKNSGKRLLHEENPEEPVQHVVSLKKMENKGYIFSVFLLTTLIYFMFYSFDLLLNTLVEKKFPDELEMAGFYGILFATYDIVALLSGLFLSSWILHKFGVIFSLTLLPVILTVMLSAAFIINLIPAFAFLIFPIIVITAILENMTREVIHDESTLLLLQPLRPYQRAWAQMKNEVSVQPIAMSIIGGILLFITHYFEIKVSNISLIVIGFALTAFALVVFILKKGYFTLLSKALSKVSIINPSFTKIEHDSLKFLKERLKSNYSEEVIYVLETINNLDEEEFATALLESLDHPSEEVRRYCLKKIEENKLIAAKGKVKEICSKEINKKVLGPALLALGSIGGDTDNFTLIHEHLNDSDPEIVSKCLFAFVKYGNDEEKLKGFKILHEKLMNPQDPNRLFYIEALSEFDIPEKMSLLLLLLKDSDPLVRSSACKGAFKLANEMVYPPLIDNLANSKTSNSAFLSLVSMGNPIVEYIMENYQKFPENIQSELIKILGHIKNNQTKGFLRKILPTSNRKLFYTIISSLQKQSYESENKETEKSVQKLIKKENENILKLKEVLGNFGEEKAQAISALIRREIEICQEACFLLLTFIYPQAPIVKSMTGVFSKDEDVNSYAIELLSATLNEGDKKELMGQLSFRPYATLSDEKVNVEEGLRKIISFAPKCYISSMVSAAVYTVGDLKLTNLKETIQSLMDKNDPYLKETLQWSMRRL